MRKATDEKYIDDLRERGAKSKVYKSFQMTGLEIAGLLNDEKHKSLYIKLSKEYDADKLLALAKDVASRKHIENKGGYFMIALNRSRITLMSTQNKTLKKDENNSVK